MHLSLLFFCKISYLNYLLSLQLVLERRGFMTIYCASCLLSRFLQNFNFWIGTCYTPVSMIKLKQRISIYKAISLIHIYFKDTIDKQLNFTKISTKPRKATGQK